MSCNQSLVICILFKKAEPLACWEFSMSPEVCLASQQHRCCKNFAPAKHRAQQGTKSAFFFFFLVKFAVVQKKFCRLLRLQGNVDSFLGGIICCCSVNKGADVTIMQPCFLSTIAGHCTKTHCSPGRGLTSSSYSHCML